MYDRRADDQLSRQLRPRLYFPTVETYVASKLEHCPTSVARHGPETSIGGRIVDVHDLAVDRPSAHGIETEDTDAAWILRRERTVAARQFVRGAAHGWIRITARYACTTDAAAYQG
jgi:hypothetical protein